MGWEIGPNELVRAAELAEVEESSDFNGGLVWEGAGFVARLLESEGSMVQHLLGIVMCVGRSLCAEVPQHGVRFPAREEHEGVLVDLGAEEEGGGAIRSQGVSAE